MKTKYIKTLLISLAFTLVLGCATGKPQSAPNKFDTKFYDIVTNQVPVLTVTSNTTTGAFETNTTLIPTYTYTKNQAANDVATLGGAVATPFGFGGLVSAILGGAFGIYATLKNKKSTAVAVSAIQGIETLREVLKTTPQGQQLDQKFMAWLVKDQAASGVIQAMTKLVDDTVNTDEAKGAAAEVNKPTTTI